VQAQVLNLLKDLQARLGIAMVFIAHDLAVVRHISQRIAVMYLGHIVEIAPAAELFARPQHPYTRALLSAIPVPQPKAARQRMILSGDVPSPIDPPAGCRFHTRCPFATDLCRQSKPAMETTGQISSGDGHSVACHHWRDLPAAAPLPAETDSAGAARLARLQAKFTETAS
jgi:oligopeptide transport system ATP-binding protein